MNNQATRKWSSLSFCGFVEIFYLGGGGVGSYPNIDPKTFFIPDVDQLLSPQYITVEPYMILLYSNEVYIKTNYHIQCTMHV